MRREIQGSRCARAKHAVRMGYGGERRGAAGGLRAHKRHAEEPRAGDTTEPPHCVPATVKDRYMPARARVRLRRAKKSCC